MKATRYIVFLGIVGLFAFGACSKDETETGDSTTRSAVAVNDSTENDSTSGGGISIAINEEWKGDTMNHF